jgi:hypothetical protein
MTIPEFMRSRRAALIVARVLLLLVPGGIPILLVTSLLMHHRLKLRLGRGTEWLRRSWRLPIWLPIRFPIRPAPRSASRDGSVGARPALHGWPSLQPATPSSNAGTEPRRAAPVPGLA